MINRGLIVLFLLCLSACSVASLQFIPISERVGGTFVGNDDNPIPIEEYISQHGYPVENHEITTQDGYILTYHRIPHGKSGLPQKHHPPVLLQHGLFCASPVWVTSDNSLGFSLADAGFDVWLANARGNTYSRKHVKYDPDKDKEAFWDFSWHEMGYYDLPASIDYILNETGYNQLFYIGHSMGTTMYFVLGATRPEYMDKVRAAVTMAPVAFPWNVRGPFGSTMNSLTPFLNWLTKLLGFYEILPRSEKVLWLDRHVCAHPRLQFFCRDLVFAICGFDEKELNATVFPKILEYMPDGASFKELEHYNQIRAKGSKFKQFDYGYFGNMWRYGTYFPPQYNLTNVRAPLYIYYGLNDWVADPQDVLYAVSRLPNVQKVTQVQNEKFNHIDFMWAIDAKALIYDDIISTFHKFSREDTI